MVHEVVRVGLGREADTYERSRPTYPPEVVAWLAEHLRLEPGRRVVDLAAGTGKLTRLLLPTGAGPGGGGARPRDAGGGGTPPPSAPATGSAPWRRPPSATSTPARPTSWRNGSGA